MGRRIVLVFLTVICAATPQILLSVSPARALTEQPDDTWMTNGTVFATALSEDGQTLYVGGRFTAVRENPPGQPGGTVSVRNLAAIDVATGAAIRTWRPQVEGTGAVVRKLAVKNGKVYVAGNFTSVNSQPRRYLAAVEGVTGEVDPSFVPAIETTSGATPQVLALLPSDSVLYVGGSFNRVNSQARLNLAALDLRTGEVNDNWRPRTSARVFALEFDPTGSTIFAGGAFRTVTGSDGTSERREAVARLYTNSGDLHPWKIPDGTIEDEQVADDIVVTSTRLYVGFRGWGPNYVAAFRLDNGDSGDRLWRFGTKGDVQTIALSPDGSRLFFGGHFGIRQSQQSICGRYLKGLASLDPATGRVYCDWIPQILPDYDNSNGPWNMTITSGNQLWVGGGFTYISGIEQRNLARFTL